MRTITYYRNRKLYDTLESRYTNLTEIVTRIKSGEDIQVVSKETNQVVTNKVLVEALQLMHVPLDTLVELVETSDLV